MPSTSLLSMCLHRLNGTVIAEQLYNTPTTNTNVSTVVTNCTGPFKIVIINLGIQPSIQAEPEQKPDSIGRLVLIVTIDREIVYAHTVNRTGHHFEITGTRVEVNNEIPFMFYDDRETTICVQLFRAHIIKEDRKESLWKPNSIQNYADEESLDGTCIRSFEFGLEDPVPILEYTIRHLPNQGTKAQSLSPCTTINPVKLFNFVEVNEAQDSKVSFVPQLKYVNILISKKSTSKISKQKVLANKPH